MMWKNSLLGDGLTEDVRGYLDLRLEETKLKAAGGLAGAFSKLMLAFVGISIGLLILAFLSLALLQWLNSVLGTPWGTLVTCGGLIILLILVISFRKALFGSMFENIFKGALGIQRKGSVEKALEGVGTEIGIQEKLIALKYERTRESLLEKLTFAGIISSIADRIRPRSSRK